MFAWLKRYSPGPPVYLFAAALVARIYVLFRLTAKASDAAGEDNARAARDRSRGFENVAATIEVDAQGVVEALFTLTANHGGEMEYRSRRIGTHRGKDGLAITDVSGHLAHPRVSGRAMKDGIEQHDLVNFLRRPGWAGECAAFEKFLAKLGAEETSAAGDDNFHACVRGT